MSPLGFGDRIAALYTEHSRGDSAFRAEIAGIRKQVIDAKVVKERPVLDTAQTVLLELLNANSYQKGGMVLHMLRREVGDNAFFRGIRSYWLAHRHATATTDALRQHMEREAGRDLQWFFDQWLTRPGYAEVELSHTWDASTGTLVVNARQNGRFGAYRLQVPVDVEATGGVHMRSILEIPANAESVITVRLGLQAPPTLVKFDPAGEVLAVLRAP